MEVINKSRNQFLSKCSQKPFRGYYTGPARVVLGVIQVAVNVIALPIILIPTATGHIKKSSQFHAKKCARDAWVGGKHFFRGYFELLSFTSMIIDRKYTKGEGFGKPRPMRSDHPFKREKP